MSRSEPDRGSPGRVFVDANLPVLLVAGATDPRIICRHKRLQPIGLGTYARLRELVAKFRSVPVTPNPPRRGV